MTILKTTAALSLAVLISFGASGCSGSFSIGSGEPTQTQTPQASGSSAVTEKPAVSDTEEVRIQAEETLNELQSLYKSEKFVAFSEEIGVIEASDPDSMVKIEAILDNHKSLQDELKEKIGLSPDALRGYQGIFAMSNASMETPYSEKFINSAIFFSALGDIIGTQNSGSQDISFGVTSNAITESSGEYKLSTYGIYIKDSNNAVIEFPDSASASYGLENGGKKIIIEEVDGDVRDEKGSASYDFIVFEKVKEAYLQDDFKDLKSFVNYLNSSEFASDAEFEAIEKNGVDYIKVSDPDTSIMEKELIYASPVK